LISSTTSLGPLRRINHEELLTNASMPIDLASSPYKSTNPFPNREYVTTNQRRSYAKPKLVDLLDMEKLSKVELAKNPFKSAKKDSENEVHESWEKVVSSVASGARKTSNPLQHEQVKPYPQHMQAPRQVQHGQQPPVRTSAASFMQQKQQQVQGRQEQSGKAQPPTTTAAGPFQQLKQQVQGQQMMQPPPPMSAELPEYFTNKNPPSMPNSREQEQKDGFQKPFGTSTFGGPNVISPPFGGNTGGFGSSTFGSSTFGSSAATSPAPASAPTFSPPTPNTKTPVMPSNKMEQKDFFVSDDGQQAVAFQGTIQPAQEDGFQETVFPVQGAYQTGKTQPQSATPTFSSAPPSQPSSPTSYQENAARREQQPPARNENAWEQQQQEKTSSPWESNVSPVQGAFQKPKPSTNPGYASSAPRQPNSPSFSRVDPAASQPPPQQPKEFSWEQQQRDDRRSSPLESLFTTPFPQSSSSPNVKQPQSQPQNEFNWEPKQRQRSPLESFESVAFPPSQPQTSSSSYPQHLNKTPQPPKKEEEASRPFKSSLFESEVVPVQGRQQPQPQEKRPRTPPFKPFSRVSSRVGAGVGAGVGEGVGAMNSPGTSKR